MTVDNVEEVGAPRTSPAVKPSPDDLLLMGDLGAPLLMKLEESVTTDSLDAARAMATSVGRRVDIPVRKSFVRPMVAAAGPKAPLAQIYSGGRSGAVAVKVYLALLWKCSAAPYCTDKPARAWATLLDLDDPSGLGARRVKDALRALEAAGLITMRSQPGYPNVVTLLDESGLGIEYEPPSTAYSKARKFKAKQKMLDTHTYFKVPQALWTRGYIQLLSGPALVMLLILLAERAGEGQEVWFSTEEFPKRYNISHKTRAAGTKELIDKGLLTVESRSLAAWPGASTFETQRRRKVYRLTSIAQTTPTGTLPSPAKPPRYPDAPQFQF